MSFKFTPVTSHALVLPDLPPEKIGLIIVPETAKDAMMRQKQAHTGTLIALGPGMPMKNGRRWPMPDVPIGNKVVFYAAGATEIELDGVKHLVVRDDTILGELIE